MSFYKTIVICDSHGSGYGGQAFFDSSEDCYIFKYGGFSIVKIYEDLKNHKLSCEKLIIQIGNPDVHPRLPIKLISLFGKLHPSLGKQHLYSLTPKLSYKSFINIPLFLLRRLITIFWVESYSTPQEIILNISRIAELIEHKDLFVFQIFQVNRLVYGRYHNTLADETNQLLNSLFRIVDLKGINFKFSLDYFHFNTKTSTQIKKQMLKLINGNK